MPKVKLKLLNKLTGEINYYEIDPNDPDALAAAEMEAKAFVEEIDKFRAEIKTMTEQYMSKNDYKPVPLKDGSHQWVFRAPQRLAYSFVTARSFIDEDMLISAGVVSVQSGKLKKLASDLVRQNAMPDGFWEAMEETAERSATKPYVMLERLK